jgi:hypothetical protein
MSHNAVWVGWNNRIAGDDTTRMGRPAAYELTLGDSLRSAWRVDGSSAVVFSLAPTDAKPAPRQPKRDSTAARDSGARRAPARRPAPRPSGPDTTAFDLSVELTDASGTSARVPLSAYGAIRRPIESYVYIRSGRDKARFGSLSELVLQTYVIPFADFRRAAPAIDLDRVTRMRFLFDRTRAGTVVIDKIGFSRMSPDYFVANEAGGRRPDASGNAVSIPQSGRPPR